MATESERSVDELLIKSARIDQLTEALRYNRADELLREAREILLDTQSFIDNNKTVIPSYSLKKITDSLRKLESKVNEPQKNRSLFKFKSSATKSAPTQSKETSKEPEEDRDKEVVAHKQSASKITGFRDETNRQLELGFAEVEYKDVSLINLKQCNVKLIGLANTVYICDLRDSTVIVGLACRAITIANCSNCQFKLVCQQLRIDSTTNCTFDIFTSARSMLEASRDLEFREISFDDLEDLSVDEVHDLLKEANFNVAQNNWECIDDFDWLSPDTPSKNFRLSYRT